MEYDNLSDFERGYIDGLLDDKGAYEQLTSASLRFIKRDCLAYQHTRREYLQNNFLCKFYDAGCEFWQQRQAGKLIDYKPLLVFVSCNGEVHL